MKDHYSQLDSFRAIAAILVINCHWLSTIYPVLFNLPEYPFWKFGHYSVQFFFVLSGFLITEILLKHKRKGSDRTAILKAFYVRRALRLVPIYFLFLLFLILIKDQFLIESLPWFLTYTANIKFFLHGGLIDTWSNHLWTLSIEEQYYLLFPLLFLFVPKKIELSSFFIMIIGSLIFKGIHYENNEYKLLLFTQVDMLAAGGIIAIFNNDYHNIFEKISNKYSLIILGMEMALICFVYLTQYQNALLDILFELLLILAFSQIIALTTFNFKGIIGKFLDFKFLKYLGKISYGLYLYHKIVPLTLLIIMNKMELFFTSVTTYYIINFLILLIVAQLSWTFVEQPILSLKKHFNY